MSREASDPPIAPRRGAARVAADLQTGRIYAPPTAALATVS